MVLRVPSKALDLLIQGLFYVGVLAGMAMAVLIFASAVLRYVAGSPISFSDELAGLLFVTLAFTTFPYVMDRAEHIRLSILTDKFGPLGQRICRFFGCLIFFAFAVVFVYESYNFTDFSVMIESRSDVSGILLWPWMALMPISLSVCLLVEIRALWRLITTGDIQQPEGQS